MAGATWARRAASAGLAAGVWVVLAAIVAWPARAAGEGSFRVTFDPPLSQLQAQGNPDSDRSLTTVTVQVLRQDGRPARHAVIDLTLTAPRFGPLARSDVPRVEGRQLVHLRALAPDGRQSFKYVWPIRGRYGLDLAAAPAPGRAAGFAPFREHQSFKIAERSGEATKFIALLAILFALGLVSAIVLGRARLSSRGTSVSEGARRSVMSGGRTAPRRASGARSAAVLGGTVALLVCALLVFLVVNQINDSRSDARVGGYQGAGKGIARTAADGPVELRYRTSRSSSDGIGVRTLVASRASVHDRRTGAAVSGAAIRIEAIDLEGNEPVFATQATTPPGGLVWDNDFWDGVDYDVRVAASPGVSGRHFAPLSTSASLAVEPMSPPLGTKLLGLAYMLFALVLGVLAGLLFARRRWGRVNVGSMPAQGRFAGGTGMR